MKRYVLALCMLASCVTVSAYNPYAPNQFDKMEENSWEYQAVRSLTEAGLTGAPMSRFSASYDLTRYEMTEMVAEAIRNRAKADAAQKAQIERLEKAFEDDLEYRGLRKKEEETPTITVSGETRIRYTKGVKDTIDNRTDVGIKIHIPN